MSFITLFIGGLSASGVLLIFQSIKVRKISMAQAIAPYLGLPSVSRTRSIAILERLRQFLIKGESAPWASDDRIITELRRCSSSQSLTSFRFEQLIFASISTLLMASWISLRLLGGHEINAVVGFGLLILAFLAGGSFRSWLLKEAGRKLIKAIEAQLPAVLDLLAFSVSAGEPILSSIQRVAKTTSGELATEIQKLTTSLSLGENFLVGLERIQKELGSQSIARAFRALIMAMERGTPIADVLRAQAMDARHSEARKLMILAGKKETLMMIPVVFLILPMIVIVALYPGLMALQNF